MSPTAKWSRDRRADSELGRSFVATDVHAPATGDCRLPIPRGLRGGWAAAAVGVIGGEDANAFATVA